MAEDTDITSISYKLYKIMNKEIGSKEIIQLLQTRNNILHKLREEYMREVCNHDHFLSGSRAEGFRFPTSDVDFMVVYNVVAVIINDATIHPMASIRFKMETDQTRCGFCLLRFVSQNDFLDTHIDITELCVPYKDGLYLTNTAWKDYLKRYIKDSCTHGPCESGILDGMEYDIAHSLKCKWPKSAYPCIQKLLRTKWPSLHDLSGIVSNGCHIVPIGDKTSYKEFLEWRISFSVAETSLIQEMNHCQFLTYGLLKMFLKEAINTYMRPDADGLLCSYFIKTTVLWEIVYSGPAWREQDLLKWFWICFRRLLSWVSDGYCPNFFIPENNMFLGKIYGRSQKNLLCHLTSLYRCGYKCLLGCTSFFIEFGQVLRQPTNVVLSRIDEDSTHFCVNVIDTIATTYHDCATISNVSRYILLIERMARENNTRIGTQVLSSSLQRFKQQVILLSAIQSLSSLRNSFSSNRMRHHAVVKYINALKRTTIDLSTHKILSAIIFYKQGMYHHVIRLARNLKERLQSPHVMYCWNLSAFKYRELGGDYTPVGVMMRKFLVMKISLNKNTCLLEVFPEHGCTKEEILYSPMVLLNFVLYLSYTYLFLFSEANSVLDELELLMNHDDGYHVCVETRAISWEMLGICQEMGGCLEEACLSYQNALKEQYQNSFLEVTLSRLRNLNATLNNY
ncbi:hypothetical protein FSP39_023810 [Pinctada imbricata]|uniref:Mab-21-like HhH/H2TH-like domain-containing protein n=1 Tax=Pinctada imbricata TaxID=66713 RepID=A0AA89BWH2_PINIB|nr:hypothetical protein FSP39_023810 [Pinctada imbricata]